MEINIKLLNENARLPKRQTEFSAGADLYSAEEYMIKSGETHMFSTGIAAEIPCGYGGFVFARSGLATKKGLAPANKVGVIDADYRGEIKVALLNHSQEDCLVCVGDRIAQLVIMPIVAADYVLVGELNNSNRGEGGFGSTGK